MARFTATLLGIILGAITAALIAYGLHNIGVFT